MNRFKNAMYNFFQGRYGIDDLYKFLFVLFIVIMIYRTFSKNFEKRQNEMSVL